MNTCEVLKYLGLDLPEVSLAQRCVIKPITMNLAVPLLRSSNIAPDGEGAGPGGNAPNIPLCDHTTAIHILTSGEGEIDESWG